MTERKWCVYKHISPSSKVYIGITCKNPEERWGINGYGYRKQTVFYNAIQKYGWDKFSHEILYQGLTHDEAIKKEIELIEFYKSNCSKYYSPMYGYNQTDGGEGKSGYRLSQDMKDKLSKKMTGKGNPFYGKHHSKETINKMSQQKIGKYIGRDNPNYGKYWNDKQRENASKKHIGHALTYSTKNKLSEIMSGENNPMYGRNHSIESNEKNKKNQPNIKKVRCVELDIIFCSISECARYFNTSPGTISSACRHGHKSHGYHFEYIGNYEEKINRPIKMFDKKMNYIKTFDCPKDASIELNIRIDNIWNVLRGDQKTAGGYIWRYADEVDNIKSA